MAQPKRRIIATVDDFRQTSLFAFAYCLPTRTEGQLSDYYIVLSVPAAVCL